MVFLGVSEKERRVLAYLAFPIGNYGGTMKGESLLLLSPFFFIHEIVYLRFFFDLTNIPKSVIKKCKNRRKKKTIEAIQE